jgi:hypothetical protein
LDENGVIAGTPSQVEQAGFEWTVEDTASGVATGRFELRVVDPVQVAITALKPGKTGKPCRAVLKAKKGHRPYLWSAEGLPAGLVLDAARGHIVGAVTAPVTAVILVRVTDSLGGWAGAVLELKIE